MRDNAGTVLSVERRRLVIASLEKARDLIAARGYQPFFGSTGEGPLNISNALTKACGDYELYLRCRQAFSSNWGGPISGLLNWETEKRRSLSEVMALFERVLTRLENNEANPSGSAPRGNTAQRPS